MSINVVCKNCGKTFDVPPCRANKARFCSPQCKNEKRDWAKTKVKRICKHCGKVFETWEAWIKKGSGQHCSRQCSSSKDIDVEQLASLYEDGVSSPKIAKMFGIGDSTVRRRLHAAGVVLRSAEEGIRLAYKTISGPDLPNFIGMHHSSTGYRLIWVGVDKHPRADARGNVREHVLVWEQANGKQVPLGWVVHHKNGIRDDNRPENLEAMTWGEHTQLHNKLRISEKETDHG